MTKYNLLNISKEIIKSKNPKEYIKKIKNKQFVYGYYLIDKQPLIVILEKAKSIDSKSLLKKILKNKKTGYELDEKTLKEKYENTKVNYFDIGTQLINYEESKIRYIYDKEANVFFRAKDLCNILEYNDSNNAIKKHINDQDKFNYKDINSLTSATPLGNEDENNNKKESRFFFVFLLSNYDF